MEEDEKKVESVENNETQNFEGGANVAGNKVVNFIKEKKVLIIAVVAIVIVLCVVYNIFFNAKGRAASTVKQYISAINSCNVKKMIKLSDPFASYVFARLDEDEYEDFWEEYQDFVKEEDDMYDQLKEAYEDSLDSDELKDAKEEFKDEMEDKSIKVKDIKSVKKEGKNLYKVKAKLTLKDDDDKDTETVEFYVMKNGMSYYMVSGFGAF